MSIDMPNSSQFQGESTPYNTVVDDNGDVLPGEVTSEPDEPDGGHTIYAEADKEFTVGITQSSVGPVSVLPPAVYEAVYDAAVTEDKDRTHGMRPERIVSRANGKLGKRLIQLHLQGIDISHALPPHREKSELPAPSPQLTSQQEARIDQYVDSGVMSYDMALERISKP